MKNYYNLKTVFSLTILGLILSTNLRAQGPYANYNHWIIDGQANAIAEDANYVYVGGNFSYAGPPTGSGAKITITNTTPNLNYCRPNGQIKTAISDGSGGWFIGGTFNAIVTSSNTTVTRNNIAHLLNTGDLDMMWNPNPDNAVNALVLSGSDVYVGGNFMTIGGQARNGIAKLSATGTGTVDATWNPTANGGYVNALVLSGSDVYVGGSFIIMGGQARNRIAKLSATGSGTVDTTWNPNVTGSNVFAIALSGSDVYVGGQFTNIGGFLRNNIAKLSATGNVDAAWNPNANSNVLAIAVSGSDVFVGGDFNGTNSIGGQYRNRIAKLSATGTGAVDVTWDPNATDGNVLAITLSGSDMYVGGGFANIGGQSRNKIAKLSTTGIGTADITWDPNAMGSAVNAIALSGIDMYVGGNLSSIGCYSRNNVARFSKLTGEVDVTWNPNANSTVSAIAVSGSDVYVGGGFTTISGQSRNSIAKLSAIGTGTADATWDPNANNFVRTIALSGSDMYVGGDFLTIGGQSRNSIAKLSTTGSGTVDATWNPNANGPIRTIALSGSDVYVGGHFTSVGGQVRNRIAKLSATGAGTVDATWNPNANQFVFAIALLGNEVFVGGNFTNIGGQSRNRIAKLSATGSGTVDATWNPNPNSTVGAIALSGSDVYVGGWFTAIDGQYRNCIAKLNATGTGTADANWDPNTGGNITSIVLSGNDLYFGGSFGSVGFINPRKGIALINCILPTTPTLGAVSNVICYGTNTNLNVINGALNNATNWQWYNTNCGSGAVGSGTTISVSPTITTTYFVRGEGGCVGTSAACNTITINVNTLPIITVNSGSICSGKSFTLNPMGAISFTYSGGSAVVSPISNTTFTVSGSNVLGCVGVAVSSITVNSTPTISVNSGSICSGNSFTMSPSGASTYTYSIGSAVVSPTVNSTYSVVGTSSLGCVSSNTAVSFVTIISDPTVSVNSGSLCSGNSFTMNPIGASTYTYSSGSAIVSPTVNSTYYVVGTSSLGCVSSNTAVSSVTISAAPTLSFVGTNSVCIGSSASFIINGASTYSWSTGAPTPSVSVSPTITTTYSVVGTNTLGCTKTETISIIVNNTCQDVWPGDVNSDGIADNIDVLELGLHIGQTGVNRAATSNLWQSYFSNNWVGTITSGKNVNHSDCNGDGTINQSDTLAIYNNYGLTHAFKPLGTTVVDPQLNIVSDQSFVEKGKWGTASVYLGDAVNPINTINGVAYTLNYDNSLIETDSVYLDYPISFINASNQNLHFRKRNFTGGVLFTATTHTTNTNVSGNGKIAIVHFKIKQSLLVDAPLNFSLVQGYKSEASGVVTPLTVGATSVLAVGASVGLSTYDHLSTVTIFPNPTNGVLNIEVNLFNENMNVMVYNALGQIVLTDVFTTKSLKLHTNALTNGIYFIDVMRNNKTLTRSKFVKE